MQNVTILLDQVNTAWNAMSSDQHLIVIAIFIFGCFQAARFWRTN